MGTILRAKADQPRNAWQSIYSKQLSRSQNWYSANCGVLHGCTLAPPGEDDWTVHVRWRCGLVSDYFDHLLLLLQTFTVRC